ncbi:MAG: hypothetical protein HY689_08340 [Chloroflexi bacterium]|nr:hypothetical protein [Chloroflexota bacterium]
MSKDVPEQRATQSDASSSGAEPTRVDLSDEELVALVQRTPDLDPHSKRYWMTVIPHLTPEHRQALAATLLGRRAGD